MSTAEEFKGTPLHQFLVAVASGRSLGNAGDGTAPPWLEPVHYMPISAFSLPVTVLEPGHFGPSTP